MKENIESSPKKDLFIDALLKWYERNGRDFPWRKVSDPYLILISEILLQKTRAENIIAVFKRFVLKYPNAEKLSKASFGDLKKEIEILGLHTQRATKLRKLARILVEKYNGKIPDNKNELLELPGIGLYIANAVLCFAFNNDFPLLDTNIGRIIERVFTVKVTGEERKKSRVWEIIATYVPKDNSREYNYALIDFGALVCTARNPRHNLCPLAEMCDYYYMAKINNEYSTKHSSRCKRLT